MNLNPLRVIPDAAVANIAWGEVCAREWELEVSTVMIHKECIEA